MNNEIELGVYNGIRETLVAARRKVYSVVNSSMVQAYWEIGRQITEAQGNRAGYGKRLMRYLSEKLTDEFGKGFTERNLRAMRQFYQAFENRHTVCAELSWSHYRLLIKVANEERRIFYTREAIESGWSVRQLDRQINSFYYERLLATQDSGKESVRQEIQKLEPRSKRDELFKDPYVLEFLELSENKAYLESDLEQGLIDKLHDFLLELGKGFSFVARQKRISSDTDHFYIDLVFYNYILKCFVLIDLKTGKLNHKDIGLMDFYVRLFEDKVKQPDDNQTIGIILCAGKDDVIAKYSVLSDNENLMASKYMLYLPTEEELSREMARERDLLETGSVDE
jgi:predicted nuclease of restriction endonuclease-like (RecB) superfamily